MYRGFELDRFQRHAIDHIEGGHSVIVAAPTGTGKTLIADYFIDHVLGGGGHVIYTSPVKALSNQKYRQYVKLFGRDAIGLVTGDLVINRDAPVRIMTTEILRNILLEGRAGQAVAEAEAARKGEEEAEDVLVPTDVSLPDLDELQAVIIDEIHFLDDPERGTVWEELLIYLPREIRILGLSATLSNLEEFADWLSSIRGSQVEVVLEEKRAVPLQVRLYNEEVGLAAPDAFRRAYGSWKKQQRTKRKQERRSSHRGRRGSRRGRRGGGDDEVRTTHMDVIRSLPGHAYPALYFIFSRKLVEVFAHKMAESHVGRRLALVGESRGRVEARLEVFQREQPDVLTPKLRRMYMRGIAFHHAGLHVSLKALVEELYEAGLINLLYCTSTFALGINMPARTVVFDSLHKFDGTAIVPLTVREFMQMAGRAGRRGLDDRGDVVVRQDFSDFEDVGGLLQAVLEGASEPVTSSFNLSFNSVANLLDRFDEEQIRGLLERSFHTFQSARDAEELREEIARREQALEVYAGDGDGDDASEHEPSPKERDRLRKHRKRLASLRRALVEEERPRMWEEFQRKVSFLRSFGYLSENNELLTPARILQKIKFEEIFMTELILEGVFEDLDPEQIFAVTCGMVQTFPKRVKFAHPPDEWRPIVRQIFDVFDSDVVRSAEALTSQPTVFTPDLLPLGERWALGDSLASILESIHTPIDISGDLVGTFRRAKDLCGQLRNLYHDVPERRRELTALLRRVTRDEVEVID